MTRWIVAGLLGLASCSASPPERYRDLPLFRSGCFDANAASYETDLHGVWTLSWALRNVAYRDADGHIVTLDVYADEQARKQVYGVVPKRDLDTDFIFHAADKRGVFLTVRASGWRVPSAPGCRVEHQSSSAFLIDRIMDLRPDGIE